MVRAGEHLGGAGVGAAQPHPAVAAGVQERADRLVLSIVTMTGSCPMKVVKKSPGFLNWLVWARNSQLRAKIRRISCW